MEITDSLRTTHQEIQTIVSQILENLDESALSEKAKEVRSLLVGLSGKLGMHLAVEDKSLYPNLLKHENDEVRLTAKKFMDEMGGISAAFKAYLNKWPHSRDIAANPNDFIRETKNVFRELSDRIDREDNELYKLVDNI